MTVLLDDLVFWLHAGSTLFMAGVIWFVQLVHYPLMAHVDPAAFPAFAAAHVRRTTWVVAPAMLLELGSAIALFWFHPMGVTMTQIILAAVLLGVIWLSTQLIQVPCHARLGVRFDPADHAWLVRSNWLRTLAWTARVGIVSWMLVSITGS